ncbi:MAG: SDR family NAD(P)-dependent oxidoreductase [Myxococcaceae bacterium]|nr:SDR family NAD(P)-dependent oxidoreductase [Myxococcaceae bacterium]MCI0669031.1 SDR family NAD(P)-dependent oxidoreductase [Myxococcaceae bacterium]
MAKPEYRNVLITGASSGLGRGLAAWFAKRGATVYAAARRAEQLAQLAHEVEGGPGRVEPVTLDVADSTRTVEVVRELDRKCGGLDLVVANAGVGAYTSGRRMDWGAVERILKVNVEGAAATLCAALPSMVERRRGHLVGISSLAGLRGVPRFAAYSASKAFLSTFLESLRLDLHGTGVNVTCLYPGYVKSEMTAQNTSMPFLLETEDAVERMGRAIERGEEVFLFPWQAATAMRLVRTLPRPLYDRVMRGRR